MIKTWDPQTCKFQVMLTVSPDTMFFNIFIWKLNNYNNNKPIISLPDKYFYANPILQDINCQE